MRLAMFALLGTPLFLWFGNRWFGGWSGFKDDLIEFLKLKFVFMIGSDLWDAWAGTIRLVAFLVLCGGAVLATDFLLFPGDGPAKTAEVAR
jgi:hypothetical protein